MDPFRFALSSSGDGPVVASWQWPLAGARTSDTTARAMFGIQNVDRPKNPLPGLAWEQRFAYDPRNGLRRAQPYGVSERRARVIRTALHVSVLARTWLAHEANLRLVETLPAFEDRVMGALRDQMVLDARGVETRVRPIRLQGLRVRSCYVSRQGWHDSSSDARYDQLNHMVSVALFDRDDLFGEPLIDRADAHFAERLTALFASAAASAREQFLGRLPVLPPS